MRIYAMWRNLAWENNDISGRHHWFPREMTSEIFVLMTRHFPALGGVSDWLKEISFAVTTN